MIGGSKLLDKIKSTYKSVEIRYSFPFLRICIRDQSFGGVDDEGRDDILAERLGLTNNELRSTCARLFLRFDLLIPGEDWNPPELNSKTWLGLLGGAQPSTPIPTQSDSRGIHFFGFKGGQGRSTCAALFARHLAKSGLNVLLVDLDAEAPSLDLLFDIDQIPVEATIVGLRAGLDVQPIPVESPRGTIFLLAFRPTSPDYDLDAAALAAEAGIYAPSHEALARELASKLLDTFNFTIFDHRTGLAPTVPAWTNAIPGPLVVFDRLDGQSRRAVDHVERLWKTHSRPALVSYVPISNSADFRALKAKEAGPWFDAMARSLSELNLGEMYEAADVEDRWVLWPNDPAMFRQRLPPDDELAGAVRLSLRGLRRVLEIETDDDDDGDHRQIHLSGAADEAIFIMTEATRKLTAPGSQYRLILGRKGTGKTRLLKKVFNLQVGTPLITADDAKIGGLPARNLELQQFIKHNDADKAGLWWTLIALGLEEPTAKTATLEKMLSEATRHPLKGLDRFRAAVKATRQPSVFLFDGLETMFGTNIHEYVVELFNVFKTIEMDEFLRRKVSLRLFLRKDLMPRSFQNLEQLTHGRIIELEWTFPLILNFVISRLPHLRWFATKFHDTIDDITSLQPQISQGTVPDERCLGLIRRIFPSRVPLKNATLETFLRTYFCDDPGGAKGFYPRVFIYFLEHINNAGPELTKNRVSPEAVKAAYNDASKKFLEEVLQELRYMVSISEEQLARVIRALDGKSTPFEKEDLIGSIQRTTKLKKTEVEDVFRNMKDVGIFEEHPTKPGWRVGRLFKPSLGMKYSTGG